MLETLNTKELLSILPLQEITQRDDIVIVDVREKEEFNHEHINGAVNMPLSQIGSMDLSAYKEKTAIFHCRSGNRTKMNEQVLAATPFKKKYCLGGGITEWKGSGQQTKAKVSAPIDVMRQMQIIVSLMILLGVLLSYTASPYFIILTILAGLGLMVAGLTGFCGMVVLLKHLPWNKAK